MENPHFYFREKRILITGAFSGIGLQTALYFLRRGAKVAMLGRIKDSELMNQLVKAFGLSNVGAFACDLVQERQFQAAILSAANFLEGLDILINAAGKITDNEIARLVPKEHDSIMDINLRAAFKISQLCTPALLQTKGCIVNVSWEWGTNPMPGVLSYCMSKAGLEMLTKCQALELAEDDIRVNAVAPGHVQTDLMNSTGLSKSKTKDFYERIKDASPMHQLPTAFNIVHTIAFLCSSAASAITGNVINVDGASSLAGPHHVDWEGQFRMNARFAPTGPKIIPKVEKIWQEEIVDRIRKPTRDSAYYEQRHYQSNWATHLADAHIKVEETYSKIERDANKLYEMGNDDEEENS